MLLQVIYNMEFKKEQEFLQPPLISFLKIKDGREKCPIFYYYFSSFSPPIFLPSTTATSTKTVAKRSLKLTGSISSTI